MKDNCIIIDIDGTLADISHRREYVEKRPKQWARFNAGIGGDKLNKWCKEIIDRFLIDGEFDVLLVTGRMGEYEKITTDWLEAHGIRQLPIYFRKTGDYRPDYIVKEEIYRKHIEPHYNVLFAIEDRNQIVDMWRKLGITCLQCAKGDF